MEEDDDIKVQKIRLIGMVERLNRHAAAVGQNGKIKGARGVIQLKKVGIDNHWQIWISIAKDLDGQRYDVMSIQKMRTNFISEGKLSIEIRTPPFTLMIRDVSPPDLQLFVAKIGSILKGGPRIKPLEKMNPPADEPKNGETSTKMQLSSSAKAEAERRRTPGQGGSCSGLKRSFAQMDMSKTEAASIRKSLKMATGNLIIANRADYPLRGFPADLKRLTMQKLLLKKIDYRLQDLLYLKVLSLAENRITSIDSLAFLKSRLEHLNVSNNEIERIKEDLFLSRAFSELKSLNLSDNRLRTLPNSIVELVEMKEFQVANNCLQVLPYNLHRLRSLVSLRVNGNRLVSLPSPISMLNLNILDISGNPFNGNSLRRIRSKIALTSPSEPPTLFELAGSKLLTIAQQQKNRYLTPLSNPELVPRSIFDYLLSGKYCRSCGKSFLRYQISYQTGTGALAQEFIRNFREYSICMVSCDRCSVRREF